MEELRALLWSFFGKSTVEEFMPLQERVYAVLATINDPEAIDALAKEFRAEAIRRGEDQFAYSPLYGWGIVNHLRARRDRLRYEAHRHEGPCNCALVTRIGMIGQLMTADFKQIGESDDYYDRWKDFECPHCGAVWRESDCSTEQYSAWSWELIRAGGGW